MRQWKHPPKRRDDWEQRLHDYLVSVAEKPHAYGSHDCLLFAANAVRAVTGRDYGHGHRRRYDSPASAMRHLRRLGFDSPEALLDRLFEELPPAFAQRGDLVLVAGNELPGGEHGWDIPAVVAGNGSFAAVIGAAEGHEGLFRIARPQWLKAWKVGPRAA